MEDYDDEFDDQRVLLNKSAASFGGVGEGADEGAAEAALTAEEQQA